METTSCPGVSSLITGPCLLLFQASLSGSCWLCIPSSQIKVSGSSQKVVKELFSPNLDSYLTPSFLSFFSLRVP